MIQPVNIKGTDSTPEILFDVEKNVFEIKGESRPENAQKFYAPVFTWLDTFEKETSGMKLPSKMVFTFYLDYFNSTSSKFLMSLISKIDKLKSAGLNVEIRWEYDLQDVDMKEMGVEFSNLVSVPFTFVAIQ